MNLIFSDYVCLDCGSVQVFPMINNKKIGTIANAFCFDCQKITRHMAVGDYQTFINWNISKEADELRRIIEEKKSYGR